MKNLFVLLASLILTQQSFAGVKEDVASLGNLAMGSDAHSYSAKTATLLLKKFVKSEYGEDQELVYKEIKDMTNGDETDVGLTSLRSAQEMGGFATDVLQEAMEGLEGAEAEAQAKKISAINKNWDALIKKLGNQGVKFGYSGSGPGYCGVSFIELLIIDEADQKVYTVYLSESGTC